MKKYINKELIISCVIGIMILTSTLLIGCSNGQVLSTFRSEEYNEIEIEKICKFEYIGNGVYVDKTTGVLYAQIVSVPTDTTHIVVLFNADGTPKNIKDFTKNEIINDGIIMK